MIYTARTTSPAAISDPPPRKVLRPALRTDAASASSETATANMTTADTTTSDMTTADIGFKQFNIELAERIITRIESRLPGRIRRLTVYTTDNAVVLTGECSTFYTKQIAQHTAMGVLEYERLINNIDVQVAK